MHGMAWQRLMPHGGDIHVMEAPAWGRHTWDIEMAAPAWGGPAWEGLHASEIGPGGICTGGTSARGRHRRGVGCAWRFRPRAQASDLWFSGGMHSTTSSYGTPVQTTWLTRHHHHHPDDDGEVLNAPHGPSHSQSSCVALSFSSQRLTPPLSTSPSHPSDPYSVTP